MNPVEGKPVSSGTHHPGVEVGDAIAIAMSQILPDRCAPQTYKYGSPRQMWGECDPRTGKPFFDHGGVTPFVRAYAIDWPRCSCMWFAMRKSTPW